MNIEQLKQRFQSLRTATVLKKSQTVWFLGIILMPTFLALLAMFYFMMIAGVSVDVNGIEYYPGSVQFERFYLSSILVTAILPAVFLVLVLATGFQKPKFAYQLGLSDDQEPFLYAETRKEATWIGGTLMLVWNRSSGAVREVTDPTAIQIAKQEIAFWMIPWTPERFKVVEKTNGFVVKYRERKHFGNESRQIRVKVGEDGKIAGYTEMVWTSYGGNSSLKKYVKYVVTEVNRNLRPNFPDALKRAILKNRY